MIHEMQCWRCKCSKCKHLWTTKTNDIPTACPKCHRITWNDDQTEAPTIAQVEPQSFGVRLDAVITPDQSKQEKLAALRGLLGGTAQPIVEPVVEDWRFTKDATQYGDDGNVYRKQVLAPAGKRFRSVQVEDGNHDEIIRVM